MRMQVDPLLEQRIADRAFGSSRSSSPGCGTTCPLVVNGQLISR
jgi:hypothetical protein